MEPVSDLMVLIIFHAKQNCMYKNKTREIGPDFAVRAICLGNRYFLLVEMARGLAMLPNQDLSAMLCRRHTSASLAWQCLPSQ